ncbi:transcription factor [Ganoderma sinense ZZ0214-1]|uniref:Transcription factor n=1 Tax=Ganoderma sinense ZZ0214-1 TaxID=1077348 RepID=A0A2G8S2H3_9APHY|nr:transcription factor [Ganoderma sinense ZZ0214-1]
MGHLATQKKSTGAGRSLSLGGARASLRRLFPKEAADIMRRYYHNVSTYPGETERVELARKVRSVAPCCSHYTARHVYQYFSNLRYRARAKNGVEQSLPSDGAYVLC